MSKRPFIYIASIMRTGSTLLGEILSKPPYSYIFIEPHLGKNSLKIPQHEIEHLQQFDIDIGTFLAWRNRVAFLQRRLRWAGWPQEYMLKALAKELDGKIEQIGVKEVRNWGWQTYLKVFPDAKVIISARDPRDIYISAHYRFKRMKGMRRDPENFNPESMALMLKKEFGYQKQLIKHADTIQVRYEELCVQQNEAERILEFVESPLQAVGTIGRYLSEHKTRVHESENMAAKFLAAQLLAFGKKKMALWLKRRIVCLISALNIVNFGDIVVNR